MNTQKDTACAAKTYCGLAQFWLFVALSIGVTFFHNQLITGPIVNAILFLSVFILGIRNAFFIALIPSLVALSTGLLPISLAPMIPFIMMGNIILVLTFDMYDENYSYLGVLIGALSKAAFLWISSYIVLSIVLEKQLSQAISSMMTYYQLISVFAGGLIALTAIKLLKIKKISE